MVACTIFEFSFMSVAFALPQLYCWFIKLQLKRIYGFDLLATLTNLAFYNLVILVFGSHGVKTLSDPRPHSSQKRTKPATHPR